MAGGLPTTVLAGFLGAGKTTLVNHLLRQANGLRITVLVNDFGELPIDQDLIQSSDGDTLALSNGCVCCASGGDLARTLSQILDAPSLPDHLLIEASGVANPDALADVARADPDLTLSGIVVVADSGEILRLAGDPRIGGQIRQQLHAADLLLLNKQDRPAPPDLAAQLRTLAPRAAILATTRSAAPLDLVLGDLAPRGRWRADPAEPRRHEADYVRWAWVGDHPIDRARLEALLAAPPAGLLRLKGFVALPTGQPLEIQAGPGWSSLEPAAIPLPNGQGRVVAIGLRGVFDSTALDAVFAAPA